MWSGSTQPATPADEKTQLGRSFNDLQLTKLGDPATAQDQGLTDEIKLGTKVLTVVQVNIACPRSQACNCQCLLQMDEIHDSCVDCSTQSSHPPDHPGGSRSHQPCALRFLSTKALATQEVKERLDNGTMLAVELPVDGFQQSTVPGPAHAAIQERESQLTLPEHMPVLSITNRVRLCDWYMRRWVLTQQNNKVRHSSSSSLPNRSSQPVVDNQTPATGR